MKSHPLQTQLKLLEYYSKHPDCFLEAEVGCLVREGIFTTSFTKITYRIIKAYHEKDTILDGTELFKKAVSAGVDQKDAAELAVFQTHPYMSSAQIKEEVEVLFNNYVVEYLRPKLDAAASRMSPADPYVEINKIKDAINTIELAVNNVSKKRNIKDVFDKAVQRIKDLKSGVIEHPGFSWGIRSLDDKTLGILRGITTIGATKGGGKTSLLVNVIKHNAIDMQIPVLFFSMEMPAEEIMTNLIANIRRINSKLLRSGNIHEDDISSIEKLRERLNNNFEIDETGGITWAYFEAKVRSFRKEHKIPSDKDVLVLLDYLQLMKNLPEEMKMNKEERVETTCNELMRICKNEHIALVKLSQFSREGDSRAKDTSFIKDEAQRTDALLKALRPRMTDLKGSGAIEANSHTIILLYRPEYYGITEAKGKSFKGICEANIVKARYAGNEPLYLKFDGKYNLFEEYTPDNEEKGESF